MPERSELLVLFSILFFILNIGCAHFDAVPPFCGCLRCPENCPVCPERPGGGSGSLVRGASGNYLLLFNSENHVNFGLTGLMAAAPFLSACYGQVNPGDSFLFPGGRSPKYWSGPLPTINCHERLPLKQGGGNPTLHKQLAAAICESSEGCDGIVDFVGFSVEWSDSAARLIKHNSGSANQYWFCQRSLGTCCGTNWATVVDNMILKALPNRYFMLPGQYIRNSTASFPNQILVSEDGKLTATQQGDGNFVIYGPGGSVVWASGTNGRMPGPYEAVMQGDGNFVIYGANGAICASGTQGNSGASMWLQNDNNLVIYLGGKPLWASQDHPSGLCD